MADTARTIRVVIDSSGAKTGAQQVNQALSSIGKGAGSTSNDLTRLKTANDNAASSANRHRAANDNLGKSVGNLRSLFGQASGQLGQLGGAAEGAASRMGTFTSVGRGLAGLGLVGVLGGIAVGLAAVGVTAIGTAAKVETFKANLQTMTGSAEAAEAAYAGLVQFAASTPFSLDQSIEGFTKLRALGLATSKKIMESYGNTSAAMGKSMEQMIEAVADATTGEFERLKEFGIKASKEGDKVSFTFQGVTKTVGNNSKEIQDYLVAIGETNFAGAMGRQMQTINGAFAGLEDTMFQLMATLGDGPFGKAVANMINTLSSGIAAITPLLSGIMDIFGGIVSAVWDVSKGLVSMFTGGSQGASDFQSVLDGVSVTFAFIGEAISTFGSVVGSVFGFIGNVAGQTVGQIRDWFGSLLPDISSWFSFTGQSAGESLVGILRAAQFVATQLSNIFKVALNELKSAFGQLGTAIAAALTGDFSKFKDINLSFSQTKQSASTVWQMAKTVQGDQKANRAWIDSRTSKGREGNINFDAMGGGAGAGAAKKSGPDKAAQEAERKAKAQKEFWEGMEKELELSKLTTQQAAIRRKEMEYEKIVGRDITADEKKRLTSLMEQTKANEYLQKANEDHRNKMIELTSQQEILEARLNGATNEQLEIKKAIEERIVDLKKQDITLSDTQLENLKRQVEEEAKKTQEIAKQNAMLDKADELAKQYRQSRQKADREKEYKDNVEALAYALEHGKISQTIYDETIAGMKKAIEETKYTAIEEMGGVISQLGDDIKGKWGAAISAIGDAISNIAAMAKGDAANSGPLGRIASLFGGSVETAFGEGAKEIMGGLKDLGKNITKTLGIDGAFGKTLGKALGKAGAGAEIGAATDGVMKALGIKSSKTGAQIGGAIGSFIPIPGGSIIGSILGGVVGGLFKKAKWGTSAIQMGADGELVAGDARGNKSAYKKNSNTAAGSVISGINDIAEALGATISGSPNISIGQYKGKWRVSTTGYQGKLDFKGSSANGLHNFGKDGAEEAVAFAVSESLKQGILTGISEFSQRVLKSLDTEEAVTLAQSYEAILKSIAAYKNPIKGAVDEVVSSIDTLAEQMKKAGATSEELANVEEYRSIKLQEVLKNQVTGFQSLLDDLNGDASGKSALTLLGEDMAKMNEMRATLAKGGTVDQEAFTTLGQSIMGRAQDIYGAQTSSYQSIRSDLIALSEQALGNATNAFNTAASAGDTYTAITDQTDQVTESIATTNDLLAQILAKFGSNGAGTASALKAVNGRLLNFG